MVRDLIKANIDFFDGNTLFNVLDVILKYDAPFGNKDDRDLIQDLYL